MVTPARLLSIPYFVQLEDTVVRTQKEFSQPRTKFDRQAWSIIAVPLTLLFTMACTAPLTKQARRTLVPSVGAIARIRVRREIAGFGCIDRACQQA